MIFLFPQFLATASPAEDGFEKTNWGWQMSLWRRQVGEWIEYQFSRVDPSLPDRWSLSPIVVEILKSLFWIALGLFVAWLVWLLWQEFGIHVLAWLNKWNDSALEKAKINTQESSISFLLSQARQFAKQGNYREACRHLYLAMLQQLHEKAIAPQKPSRTDGEYLKLLRNTITPVQPYETLITTHEQLCFANREIIAENYQQCQQAYQELSQQQPPKNTNK
ncbi:MAG TPA: DUF4129 domain-containing protein [Nostocaceae cyanobacterium]|nr:DUF4129 domain-containing protein [Nostocaceae cyanobacterium]